jgi:2-polyprenyl-3-methyl-5-hydroxy-6-metoxy-1,4-benzoquinol methylase
MSERLENEIEHARYLLAQGPGDVWNWETPAGRIRWARRVKMLTSHLHDGEKVLELGCGTGFFTQSLADTNAEVTAIDISSDLLAVARAQIPASNVTFEVQNAYALTYAEQTFDSVVGSSVLHHLELEPALKEIWRVLKPGGLIFFTEPNMMNPQIAVQKNIPAIKKRLGDSPDETAFFRWPLQRHLARTGFRQIRIEPFDFLHPQIPSAWVGAGERLSSLLEKTPVLREIAGSLYIRAAR